MAKKLAKPDSIKTNIICKIEYIGPHGSARRRECGRAAARDKGKARTLARHLQLAKQLPTLVEEMFATKSMHNPRWRRPWRSPKLKWLRIMGWSILFLFLMLIGTARASDFEKLDEAIPGDFVSNLAPVFDFDTDSCLPSAGISRSGEQNGGLNPTGSITGQCRSSNFLDTSNTLHRYACTSQNGSTYCGYFYALYFEKDQATIVGFGHRHDWEHAVIWTKDGVITHGSVSAHGELDTRAAADLPFENGHLKVVYHLTPFNTHSLRFAKTNESAENPYGKFVIPTLISWYNLTGDGLDNATMRAKLNSFDYGSAVVPVKDGKFWGDLNNNRPPDYPYFPAPVDNEPPTTVISLPPLPPGGWYLQDVPVTVTATDNLSGVAATECRLNGGNWFTYSIPFIVSKEGFNDTVECFSRDWGGNIEGSKAAVFNLDKFPPSSGILVSGQVYGSIGDITHLGRHHTIALYAQDTVFGPDALLVEYRVYKDGTTPAAFSAPSPNGTTFSLPVDTGGAGLWHVDFRAADPVHTFDTLPPNAFQTKNFFISARVQEDLLVFYPFNEGANTIVHDYAWNGAPLDLQIADASAITWGPGGLTVTTPTVIASNLPSTKITKAVSDTNELTLEAWIQPSQPVPNAPASIVTLATDTISRNVTLTQVPLGKSEHVRFDVALRTSKTSRKGVSLQSDRQQLAPSPLHLVATRDALGRTRLYLNGQLQAERQIAGKLAAWSDVRLALANELVGGRPWQGTYRLVALYNRALSPAEVRQNFLGGPSGDGNASTPTELQTWYGFDERSGLIVHDYAGAAPPLDLQIANPAATTWMTSGLVISTTTVLSSQLPATRLTHAITGTNEVSLEAWITPAMRQPSTLARILTLSNDPVRRNIELLQERKEGHTEAHFTVRVRTTETEASAKPPLETRDGSVQSMLQHVVFTRDALGLERIYINSVKVAERTFGGDFSMWDASYQLALGNALTNDRPWLGSYHLVEIYNRALSPAEISRHYISGSGH